MRQFVITLFLISICTITANGQTYLDHLQNNKQGSGKVTVTESKDIDELVNGQQKKQVNKQIQQTTTPSTTTKKDNHTPTAQTIEHKPATAEHKPTAVEHKIAEHPATAVENKISDVKREEKKPEITKEKEAEETEAPAVDMRKKVMRGSYKITGYRVQAFAGGNSRNDRQKAEKVGNNIKMKFPDQPVYVHFYSPRWICRVGNYKTIGEARAMLEKIRKMGYREACLVKGKITVQR